MTGQGRFSEVESVGSSDASTRGTTVGDAAPEMYALLVEARRTLNHSRYLDNQSKDYARQTLHKIDALLARVTPP